jgi:hypothetical protein
MWSGFKYTLFGFFLLGLCMPFTSATLVIEGKFQNKNILVHNSLVKNGVGYCAKEIKVNGKITSDETNSSAFEIDLMALNLKLGEKVVIEIIHDQDCRPKVLNPEDLFPKPTYELLAMNLSVDGVLSWSTKNESGSLPFVIEQFKWNKWVPVGEVNGLGTSSTNRYTFKVAMHSGKNKIRLKQKGYNSSVKVSKEATVKANMKAPEYLVKKNEVAFDAETAFEVYDIYGINLIKGYGKTFNTQTLKSGEYYLSYDNSTISFKK